MIVSPLFSGSLVFMVGQAANEPSHTLREKVTLEIRVPCDDFTKTPARCVRNPYALRSFILYFIVPNIKVCAIWA